MGADIHGILQERYSSRTDHWYNIAPVDSSRHYLLFAALAGVRNYWGVKPISEPRGLPGGFDEEKGEQFTDALGMYWGDHSFSWLTIKELVGWDGWDQTVKDDRKEFILRDHCEQFLAWLKWAEMRTSWSQDARIVFCFDS